jgi:hypothetical protein
MAIDRGMATVMAVALGLVAAVFIFHAKHDNSKTMLYQVAREPVVQYRRFPIAMRPGQNFIDPSVQSIRGFRYMPKLADEEPYDEPSNGPSAFPPENTEHKELEEEQNEEPKEEVSEEQPSEEVSNEQPAEVASEEQPLGDDQVVAASAVEQHEEPQEPDNFLGDEVIDLPRVSEANDFGDMYINGNDVEKNRCDN